MHDEPQLLEIMLADMEKQPGVFRPGPYWLAYTRRIAAAIRREGLSSFRSSTAIGRGYVDVAIDDPITLMAPGWKKQLLAAAGRLPPVTRLMKQYRRLIVQSQQEALRYKSRLFDAVLGEWFDAFARQHHLPDTLVANPQRVLTVADRRIGELYLRMFAWVHGCSGHIDLTRVKGVFEIGGGFGAMAHTLMHLFPNIRKYLYLDIPPILYVSTQYLKHFFGDAVVDYARSRRFERIRFAANDAREILMIAPWQVAKVDAALDMFWNSSSFQEMPAETVRNYAVHIERLLRTGGSACVFVYDTENTVNALSTAQVRELLQRETTLHLDPVDNRIANLILPGVLFLGSRQTVAQRQGAGFL